MIQVEDLDIAYHGEVLLKDVAFALQRGERCGLVGRNGSGKTTLLRLITGQEKADKGVIRIPKNYRLGYLDQHIRFTKPTILEETALGLRPDESDEVYKAEAILFGLGFKEEQMDLSPHSLSGGYQLRVHLAKVLVAEPDCLLLDEPTNYLDIVSIRWIGRFLEQWRREFILISHDREFLDRATTHTIGIHRREVRKIKGSSMDLFQQILLEEEVRELERTGLEKKRAHAQSYIDRFGAKASKATQAQSRQKMIDRMPVLEKLKEIFQLDFNFKEAPFPGKKMLEAHNLSFAYPQSPSVIEHFSLSIEKGERIAIIGKNGRGKSTLLRLLAQDLVPNEGELECSANLKSGYFGQTHMQRLTPEHTIEEEISDANNLLNFTEIKAICGVMMFSGVTAKKKISFLSGGEKSRVLLGKILAKPCNLLLLDEPTHHLDIESLESLIDALEDFSGAVVIVTHSELILKRLALNKIVICHSGKQQLFEGNYDEFLEKLGWEEDGSVKPKKKENTPIRPLAAKKNPKAVEAEIKKCEQAIIALEEQLDKLGHEMATFSSDSAKIQELMKATSEKQQQLEKLYAQFAALDSLKD